ncbi:MAG: thioredoxin [Caulobacterales bacterium]|uniref:thioredoxin n=1 Tax=Glycocaulis sp. TaxID=1969725 RepID=UPI003FA00488
MQIFGNQPGSPAPAAPASHVKDSTDGSFMADVVEVSKSVPVLVDFWAPWCGPCRQLGPVIEKAVNAAGGKVKLVKINIDENPQVAGQLRIQSIPAVLAFVNGQPVDGFMGALPESQVNDFIRRVSGETDTAALEDTLERAEAALADGDAGGAAQDFAAVLQADPKNARAIAGLARVYLSQGDREGAGEILAQVPPALAADPAIAGVRAAMELASEGEDAGDPADAWRALEAAGGRGASERYTLARALIGAGDLEGAASQLLDSIAEDREWNEGAARQLLLRVFDAAGQGSDLTKAGRKRLSSILFS